MSGELEIEFNPEGTLAEPNSCWVVLVFLVFIQKLELEQLLLKEKNIKISTVKPYILETGLIADVSLIKAWKGDSQGNLVYRKTARNFNPIMATACKKTIAEVEEIVPVGTLDPDHIHSPGIFVDRNHFKRL